MASRTSTILSAAPAEQLATMHTAHLDRVVVRAVLALISAVLLVCSLPSPDIGGLAWIALVPLIVACQHLTPLPAATVGFLTGMAANLGTYRWLFEVKGFEVHHFIILSSYFALYPAAWCAGIARLNRKPRPLLFSAPALWVLLDYLRANAGFMAFPWGTLAQTQHENLAILQFASVTGEHGVTFLVALGNAAIAQVILRSLTAEAQTTEGSRAATTFRNISRRDAELAKFGESREKARSHIRSFSLRTLRPQRLRGETSGWFHALIAFSTIALAHAWGFYVLYSEQPGPTLHVAAVQPSILRTERDTAAGRAQMLNRLDRLSRKAAASRPALIVWPETAVTGNLRADPFLTYGLLELAHDLRTPLVLGVGDVEKFAAPDGQSKVARRAYNSAYFMKPDGQFEEPYIKRVLLPFGEYVPLKTIIGWPAWLAPPAFDTAAGSGHRIFKLDDGTPFAPLICWENLFATLARESVQAGARLLVLHTNDGWFGRTAEPYQHNLASVLRAVENRVPVVVSSNAGPSQIIDAYGRIVASAPQIFSQDVVVGAVYLASHSTLYTRFGDVFIFLIPIAMGLIVVWRPLRLRCFQNQGVFQ